MRLLHESGRWLAFFLFIALWLAACGNDKSTPAPGSKKVVVATDTTLIPMSFMGDAHKIIGFEPDLLQAISEKTGLVFEIISVEWPGLFGGLITGKFDMVMSSVTILEERKRRMAFSIPYLKSGLALVVRQDAEGVESIADIRSQNLLTAAQRGTTAYFFLEKDPKLRKKGYDVYGHAVADLIKGEVDAVLGESTATLYYKNHRSDIFDKIKMVGEILTEEYYGIVMRKDDTALKIKIDTALRSLIQDGTIARLHAKWELGRVAQVPRIQVD